MNKTALDNLIIQDFNNNNIVKNNPKNGDEVFQWGQFMWDIEKAKKLARKKRAKLIKPSRDNMLPMVAIYDDKLKNVSYDEPVIIGTVDFGGDEVTAIIDGYHRMTKGIQRLKREPNFKLKYVLLNRSETKKLEL